MAETPESATPAAPTADVGLDVAETELFEQMRSGAEPAAKPTPQQQAAEPDDDGEDDDSPALEAEPPSRPGSVPHGALHKERSRRQAAEARERELTEKFARTDERLRALMAAFQSREEAQQAPPEAEPDPDVDIFAAVKHQARLTKAQAEKIQQYERQQVQNVQMVQFKNAVEADEVRFAQQTPDYFEGVNFYRESRARELAALGYQPQQVAQTIMTDFMNLAGQAFQARRSPAEMLYNYVKARGYAPKPNNGPTEAPELDLDKSERMQQRRKANTSSGSVNGAAPGTRRISARELADMSDAEFGKILNRAGGYADDKVRKLLGG